MAKTINKENRKTLFTLSRSQQIMLGVFLILISIIIFASLLSYFNSWRADQCERPQPGVCSREDCRTGLPRACCRS